MVSNPSDQQRRTLSSGILGHTQRFRPIGWTMLAGAVAGLGNVPLSAAPPTHPLSQPEYSIATKIGYCAFPFIVTMPEGTRYLRVRKTEQWAPAAMRIEMPDGPVELRVEGGWGTPPPHRENRLRRLAKWDHGKVFSYRPGEGSVFFHGLSAQQGMGSGMG